MPSVKPLSIARTCAAWLAIFLLFWVWGATAGLSLLFGAFGDVFRAAASWSLATMAKLREAA